MKIAVVILTFLMAQTSASFFSELTNSISSVQSGIGKLFSDATVDLKDTIDCTVYAVQQAFSSDGIVQGYQKCQEMNNNNIQLPSSESGDVNITPLVATTSTEEPKMVKPTNRQQKTLKSTPEATESDTKNNDPIENKSIESYLVGLVNMNSKLEREFEDLSKHVNDDFIKIENEQKEKPPIEKVMKEIDKLIEEEVIYKNKTESEIHDASDKILTKLDKNSTDNLDLKDEIKATITELEQNEKKTTVEQEFKISKEKEMESYDIKNLLKTQEKNHTMIHNITLTNVSKSTKTLPSLISISSTRATTATAVRTKTPVVRTSTPVVHTTTKPTAESTKDDNYVSRDKSTIDQALKLVRNSKRTASIMAKILKNKKSASSVFDRPDLFGS